jgi:hypothetical protein
VLSLLAIIKCAKRRFVRDAISPPWTAKGKSRDLGSGQTASPRTPLGNAKRSRLSPAFPPTLLICAQARPSAVQFFSIEHARFPARSVTDGFTGSAKNELATNWRRNYHSAAGLKTRISSAFHSESRKILMKRCWIHIGMPKTGSTSIQSHLAKRRRGPGWRYIAIGKLANMNREMHAMFGTQPERWYWFKKQGMSREEIQQQGALMRDRLAQAITRSKAENLILSSEALSLIRPRGIRALRDFLKPLCDEIKVVGYVRPPTGFTISSFQQAVKNGANSFSRVEGPLYRFRFEKYDKIFGRKNVIFRKFEPSTFTGGCIVVDFCELLGIEPPQAGEVERLNESLCREACGILYAYHKFGPGFGVGADVIRENGYLIRPLLAMEGPRFRFSHEFLQGATENLGQDVVWMEQRLGTSLAEPVRDDATDVTGEDDLLRISRAACIDFVARFQEFHGVVVKDSVIPTEDPVAPQKVADLVEHCRGIGRERMRETREKRAKSRKLGAGVIGRLFGAVRRCFGNEPEKPKKSAVGKKKRKAP